MTPGHLKAGPAEARTGGPFAATGAAVAEQADLGHGGLDRWQFNAFIDLLRHLRRFGERDAALRAGGQQLVDRAVGFRVQRSAHAGTTLARWLIRSGAWRVLKAAESLKGLKPEGGLALTPAMDK